MKNFTHYLLISTDSFLLHSKNRPWNFISSDKTNHAEFRQTTEIQQQTGYILIVKTLDHSNVSGVIFGGPCAARSQSQGRFYINSSQCLIRCKWHAIKIACLSCMNFCNCAAYIYIKCLISDLFKDAQQINSSWKAVIDLIMKLFWATQLNFREFKI